MWKPLLAATAALAIASTSIVYAQQRDHGDRPGLRHPGPGVSQEDRAAFTDARIAALRAGLRLTPDQEKNWPAFETALRDMAKMRAEHRTAMGQQSEPRSDDPVQRLRRQAEMMSTAGANLKRLADAQEPLYQSLDDSQKNRFKLLARVLTSNQRHFAQMRGHGGRAMQRMHERHHGPDDRGGMRGPRGDRGGNRGGSTGSGTAEQL